MPKKSRTTSFENIFVSETHRVIFTEISYLKKRIHLVEGERKANYESNEESLKKNETTVKDLKEKNQKLKDRRKKMLEARDSYFKQIAAKLGGEKKAYEFRDKNFIDAVDILECKIGTLRNKFNLLKYTETQQGKQMDKTLDEELRLKRLVQGKIPKEKDNNLHRRLDDIKATETGTAAMQMKITEADNIRCRYRNMITLLNSENCSINIKVAEQDRKMDSEKLEITKIRQVLQDSLRAKKLAKTRLIEIEETTIKDYSEREQTLYEARMNLKQIREKMEQIGSKLSFPKFHMIHRDSSSITEGQYAGYHTTADQRETKSQTLIETVYTRLSNMIGETDPAIIVVRFLEQRVHAKELLVQEDVAKSAVRKGKLRKRFLVDKLSQLQYSGGLRREQLDFKFAKIDKEILSTATGRTKLEKLLQDHSSAMEQMQTKLTEICQNNDLKPPALASGISPENVMSLLKFVLMQLEKLLGGMGGSMLSPVLLSPAVTAGTDDRDLLGLAPQEFNDNFPFGLSSPAGSLASFRFSGSVSDLDMIPNSNLDGGEKFPFELNGFTGIQDRSSSIAVPDMPSLLTPGLGLEDTSKREDSAGKAKSSLGLKRDSSEEEEAVSRNFVKRQSQILYEAKTRKGRFNPAMTANVRGRKH